MLAHAAQRYLSLLKSRRSNRLVSFHNLPQQTSNISRQTYNHSHQIACLSHPTFERSLVLVIDLVQCEQISRIRDLARLASVGLVGLQEQRLRNIRRPLCVDSARCCRIQRAEKMPVLPEQLTEVAPRAWTAPCRVTTWVSNVSASRKNSERAAL